MRQHQAQQCACNGVPEEKDKDKRGEEIMPENVPSLKKNKSKNLTPSKLDKRNLYLDTSLSKC